jgi:magnesium transporter
MRIFHIRAHQFTELLELPDAKPADGYLWVGMARSSFEEHVDTVQAAIQRWTGTQLVDLHVADLLNEQLPSQFDYTSTYDLLVFQRLAANVGGVTTEPSNVTPSGRAATAAQMDIAAAAADGSPPVLAALDTSPVGFAVFDDLLLTVHPPECPTREFFANRLQHQTQSTDARGNTRMPPSPADLALRMVNYLVDSYLALRRLLTRQLDELQKELFNPNADYASWQRLLDSRNDLHLLEDTCEDQRAALTEWIDAQDELPHSDDVAVQAERELLRVRARDVQEHVERVLTHVRRLESSAENAVQMHFSAQSNRTNDIMRTLTVLTAIFLPLNLVTGFFGMNFEGLPLIHSARGFWWTFGFMLVVGGSMSWYFWRKRYLARPG